MNAIPKMSDADREARIAELVECMQCETDKERLHMLWDEMTVLVNGRSPEQVKRMEAQKGLN